MQPFWEIFDKIVIGHDCSLLLSIGKSVDNWIPLPGLVPEEGGDFLDCIVNVSLVVTKLV